MRYLDVEIEFSWIGQKWRYGKSIQNQGHCLFEEKRVEINKSKDYITPKKNKSKPKHYALNLPLKSTSS